MAPHAAFRRRLLRHALVIALLAAAVAAASSIPAFAQTPPSTDQGPRFSEWGPGQPPPAPEGPAGGEGPARAPEVAPGPGGRAPQPFLAPPDFEPGRPAPDRWGGCNYDLRGSWRILGRQTHPYPFTYQAWVHVRQYRNWLHIEQPDDNLSYYGICRGDTIELDVYSGGRFVGYEDGVVSWGGARWGPSAGVPRVPGSRALRVRADWVSFFGDLATGTETWYRW